MKGRLAPVVVVASDDPFLLDEIVRYLEEVPHWRLAASARTIEELMKVAADSNPDAVLLSEGLALELSNHPAAGSSRFVVIARQDKADVLRAAIKLGARGFVQWPKEKPLLSELVERDVEARPAGAPTGNLTAVWSPKGGGGATTVAAHLALGIGGLGFRCLLVDLDLDHGDQSAMLGADDETKSFADLMRVADELNPATIDSVAITTGPFKAILAPGLPGEGGLVKPQEAVRILHSLMESTDHVVVDLPSGYSELALAVAHESSRLVLVLTADLLSLRRSREVLRLLQGTETRIDVVVNQFARGDVSISDVESVLGRSVSLKVRPELSVYRAAGRGELSDFGRKAMLPLAASVAGVASATKMRGRK